MTQYPDWHMNSKQLLSSIFNPYDHPKATFAIQVPPHPRTSHVPPPKNTHWQSTNYSPTLWSFLKISIITSIFVLQVEQFRTNPEIGTFWPFQHKKGGGIKVGISVWSSKDEWHYSVGFSRIFWMVFPRRNGSKLNDSSQDYWTRIVQ